MDLIGLDRSKKIDDNIDILLALPDIDNDIIYRSNKLKAFCTTSEIEQCKNFSNIIDAGMKALKALDKPSYDLLYNAFINKEVKDYPQFAYELDNLRTLCKDCHNKRHGRYQKQSKSFDDELFSW